MQVGSTLKTALSSDREGNSQLSDVMDSITVAQNNIK